MFSLLSSLKQVITKSNQWITRSTLSTNQKVAYSICGSFCPHVKQSYESKKEKALCVAVNMWLAV